MQPETRKAPLPLTAWLYTGFAVLAIVLLGLPAVDAGRMPDSDAFSTYNAARLQAVVDEDPSRLVVMLGDSKLKYATDTRRLAADDATTLLRIVQNRAAFSDFAKLADAILDADPDLLVVQDSLMTHDRHKLMDFRLMQEVVLWRLLAPESAFNPHKVDHAALQSDVPCYRDFAVESLARRVARLEDGSRYGLDNDEARAALDFVRRARERGIPVAILTLPNHPRLEVEMPSADREAELRALAAAEALPVWQVPASLSIREDNYCDFVHLDPDGRQKLSAWLSGQIGGVLQTGG